MGRPAIDITGNRYGMLIVLSRRKIEKNIKPRWKCKCDCGNTSIHFGYDLKKGTKSCGCLRGKSSTHGMSYTRIYKVWRSMIDRCRNQNHHAYKDYGGRGIIVCDRWLISFENFYADMGSRPDGTSIDRKNNDGNYEPGNCRWATMKEQSRNKRSTRNITHNGITMTAKEWSLKLSNGRDEGLVGYRVRAGWTHEKALTPPRKYESHLTK